LLIHIFSQPEKVRDNLLKSDKFQLFVKGVGLLLVLGYRIKNAVQNFKEFLSLAGSPITTILMCENREEIQPFEDHFTGISASLQIDQ